MGVHEPRRVFLVDKLIDEGLTEDEEFELHDLQRMRGHLDRLDAMGVFLKDFDEVKHLAKGCPRPELYENEEETNF